MDAWQIRFALREAQMKSFIGLTIAMLLLSRSTVFAESKLVELADVAKACAGDIKTFCAADIIGGISLKACKKDHLTSGRAAASKRW
jgi:hypothetical protein